MNIVAREFKILDSWKPKNQELFKNPIILTEILSLSETIYGMLKSSVGLQETVDEKMKSLNDIIKTMETKLNDKDNIILKIENESKDKLREVENNWKNNFTTQLNSILNDKTKHLNDSIHHKDKEIERLSHSMKQIQEDIKSNYQKLIEEKDSRNRYNEERIKKMEEQTEKLRHELENARTTKIIQTNNSSIKGKIAETNVEEIIRSEFLSKFPNGKCEITACGKEKGEGDLHAEFEFRRSGFPDGKYKFMIEIKDYKDNVSREELDKFHRDLYYNCNGIDGAFFISMRSSVSNCPDILFELSTIKKIPYFSIAFFSDSSSIFIPALLTMVTFSDSICECINPEMEDIRFQMTKYLNSAIRQRGLINNSIKLMRKSIDDLNESEIISSNIIRMMELFSKKRKILPLEEEIDLNTNQNQNPNHNLNQNLNQDDCVIDDMNDDNNIIDMNLMFHDWLSNNTKYVEDFSKSVSLDEIGYIISNCDDVPNDIKYYSTHEKIHNSLLTNDTFKKHLMLIKAKKMKIASYIWSNAEYADKALEFIELSKPRRTKKNKSNAN
jgi:hypothetical protein